MSDNSQAADPNAGASTAESAPAAGTGSSAPSAQTESAGSPTSASSATGSTPPVRVAAHLESIYNLVRIQHASVSAAANYANALLHAIENGVELENHELADALRRLIGML